MILAEPSPIFIYNSASSGSESQLSEDVSVVSEEYHNTQCAFRLCKDLALLCLLCEAGGAAFRLDYKRLVLNQMHCATLQRVTIRKGNTC